MTKMNRLLVTASVAALAIGTTGAAQAADLLAGAAAVVPQEFVKQRTISGTVGLYGSYSSLDDEHNTGDDFASDPWSIGGDAKVDIPFNDAWSLQLDQYGEGMFLSCEDSCTTSENYGGGYLAGAHLTFRQMDRYLVGVFGGGGIVATQSSSNATYSQWLVGVEGQMYFGNATLFGQGGYVDSASIPEDPGSDELLHNAWFLRGVARWHPFGGDGKAEGEIGWATGDQESDDDLDVFWWGAEYEHAVWSFGDDGFVSIFGRYDGYYYDETNTSDTATNHVFKIGLRVDLNNANPLARERYGAAVDLPNMNRILGHTGTID